MFSSEGDIRAVVRTYFEYGKVIAEQIDAMCPIFPNRNADDPHVTGARSPYKPATP